MIVGNRKHIIVDLNVFIARLEFLKSLEYVNINHASQKIYRLVQ